jgi:predicted RecB family nuclease
VTFRQNDSKWAQFGEEFEDRVVRELAKSHNIYRRYSDPPRLEDRETLWFLTADHDFEYAYQASFNPGDLLTRVGPDSDLSLSFGYPDLVRRERKADRKFEFTLIDIKATRNATQFHKVQVAYYALILQNLLDQGGAGTVAELAEIWRLSDHGEEKIYTAEVFKLRAYERAVLDFFRGKAKQIASAQLETSRDETFFHVYFKCEQCKYLPHCATAVTLPNSPLRDISAIPGMTHESKRVLQEYGIITLGDAADVAKWQNVPSHTSWTLSRTRDDLYSRARAQASGLSSRLDAAYTLLMPPRSDLRIFLVVDADPIDNDLVTLGYRRKRLTAQGADVRNQVVVRQRHDPEEEARALVSVLSLVMEDLAAADAWNRSGRDPPIYAQIFLYEAAEAWNLQAALGRHLHRDNVRRGLLDLIRLFPPEEVVPEPDFQGYQHLPATIVRHVIEQLYALPVVVSYDLRQVTQALALAPNPLTPPYRPATEFERPFSSLLSIDVTRSLREGKVPEGLVARDVSARLASLDALVDWLHVENQEASKSFLRLPKQPFRLIRNINPLEPADLEILQAYALLEERTTMLEHLTRLAQDAKRRRAGLRTMDGLRFLRHTAQGKSVLVTF